MSLQVYQLMHLISGFLLVAVTFQAFAAPTPERRRFSMIASGILSLLMLTGGFGLMARFQYDWNIWIFIKIAAWLVISALTGLAFRRPELKCTLSMIGAIAIVAAVWAVYTKPGLG